MKKLLSLIVFAVVTFSAFGAESAEGYWKSISDVQGEVGKVTGVWKFTKSYSGDLEAVLVWVPDGKTVYHSQKAEFDGKPLLNYPWVKGLRASGTDFWNNGTIVDVSNNKGDVYGCEIRVKDNGQRLELRGYLGLSLFGRTQTWQKVSPQEAADKFKLP